MQNTHRITGRGFARFVDEHDRVGPHDGQGLAVGQRPRSQICAAHFLRHDCDTGEVSNHAENATGGKNTDRRFTDATNAGAWDVGDGHLGRGKRPSS